MVLLDDDAVDAEVQDDLDEETRADAKFNAVPRCCSPVNKRKRSQN